ncbi:MAG: fumarate reductase (quinol) flavoprotein subunit [Planctomycetota bacterium]
MGSSDSTCLSHDILIVGGGGAGLRAAIAIGEENPDLTVGVISKIYPMRSHTVSAEGGAAAVIQASDSHDHHCYDTISGADWLADQDVVETFVEEAPRELLQLEHWGCPWSRNPDGTVAVRPFGGMKIERTWYASDKTGFHMLHSLFQTAIQYDNVTRYDEWFATKLLIEDGRCQGVAAVELGTGQVRAIGGKGVIMTTGGAGRIFPFTTNAAVKTGDGMALAYRAGVALKDMEFVQYHPTGLPGTGILITEASRGEGGILLNKNGERYLANYDLGEAVDVNDERHPVKRTMELGPRDRLSQAFELERQKGNTLQGEYGDYVHLDLRHMGEKKINKKLPFVRELCQNYVGIDPVHELIPVRPVIHYMMGGIDTDLEAATSLPGLFAAGECACVSINGANRLGSNSLTELLVFGARAARSAVRFAEQNPTINKQAITAQATQEQTRIREQFFQPGKGTETIASIRADLNRALEQGAGIYRTEESLQTACNQVKELKERYKSVELADHSLTFNTELIAVLELGSLLDVAEAVTHSALQRRESRGSHQRSDHAERDDEQFLKHSLAYQTDGNPRIEYSDVSITRWPPGDRVYGSK